MKSLIFVFLLLPVLAHATVQETLAPRCAEPVIFESLNNGSTPNQIAAIEVSKAQQVIMIHYSDKWLRNARHCIEQWFCLSQGRLTQCWQVCETRMAMYWSRAFDWTCFFAGKLPDMRLGVCRD